jgi:hypothetical protein
MHKKMKKNLIIASITAAVLILPVAYYQYKKNKVKRDLKRRILADGNPAYGDTAKNIALSISMSKKLYKELIVKVHPDRFQDELKVKATELSARITKSKRNHDELVTLQGEVENFLGKLTT